MPWVLWTAHSFGSLLFRLASHQGAPELIPLLRLLEAEPALASEMPRYSGSTGRKGVVGGKPLHSNRRLDR